MTRPKRSKFGIDVMYRLWDDHNGCWHKVSASSRSLWISKVQVERVRDALIQQGRNPDTLSVEKVHVVIQ